MLARLKRKRQSADSSTPNVLSPPARWLSNSYVPFPKNKECVYVESAG